MSKLSPKPQGLVVKKGWDDLDALLQANFKSNPTEKKSVTTRLSDYSMSFDEIKTEAEKSGYAVTLSGNDFLYFE